MPKATSTSEISLSSIMAESLLRVVGVNDSISEHHVKPTIRKRIGKLFTERVRKHASSPELWGASAKSIQVDITDDDNVVVSAVGTQGEIDNAHLLEYGTPDSPPVAVMRTYEADLNEEYKVSMREYDL